MSCGERLVEGSVVVEMWGSWGRCEGRLDRTATLAGGVLCAICAMLSAVCVYVGGLREHVGGGARCVCVCVDMGFMITMSDVCFVLFLNGDDYAG